MQTNGVRNSRRSIVWDFYKKRLDGLSVTCRLCKTTSRHFGNTTNLISHLKRKHPIELQKSQDERNFYNSFQTQFSEAEIVYPTESTSEQYPPTNEADNLFVNVNVKQELESSETGFLSEQERGYINDALLDMLIMDFHHASMVEQPGFDYFTRTLCPLFTLPTAEDVAEKLIPERYYADRNTVMELLEASESVGLSVTFHKDDLITISACFVNDYKFKRYALVTKSNFDYCLNEVLHNWKIREKITAITIDDPEKKAIIGEFEINLNNFKSISSEFENLSCGNKIQLIVDFFMNNKIASSELTKHGTNKKLTNATTLAKVEWLINNRVAITKILPTIIPSPENLEIYEWETVTDWLNLQQPIYKVLSELTNNCTISCLIPLYRGLQSLIMKKNTTTDYGAEMKCSILKNTTALAECLETSEIAAKACLLDPRFKKLGFTNENHATKACEALINELVDVLKPEVESSPEKSAKMDDDDDLWGDFNEKIAGVNNSSRSVCSGILQKYLAMPIVDRKSDPLEFWKEHSVVFPSLHKLAVKYLCVPAVPAFTEQLFPKHSDFVKGGVLMFNEDEIDRYIFLKSVLTDRYG